METTKEDVLQYFDKRIKQFCRPRNETAKTLLKACAAWGFPKGVNGEGSIFKNHQPEDWARAIKELVKDGELLSVDDGQGMPAFVPKRYSHLFHKLKQ